MVFAIGRLCIGPNGNMNRTVDMSVARVQGKPRYSKQRLHSSRYLKSHDFMEENNKWPFSGMGISTNSNPACQHHPATPHPQ